MTNLEQCSDMPQWFWDAAQSSRLRREEELSLFETVRRGEDAEARLRELPGRGGDEPGESADLRRVAAAGEQARNTLLKHNSWVVREWIQRCCKIMLGVGFSDLSGVGLQALNRAIDRFDPHRHASLATFAWESVRHSVFAEARKVRQGLPLTDHAERLYRKLKRAKERLLQELGREPSLEEMARAVPCTREKAEDVWLATQVVSLTDPWDGDNSQDRAHRSNEPAITNNPERDLDHKIFLERLQGFLAVQLASAPNLKEKERHAVQALARRVLRQLIEDGEAFRSRSALEWRLLIRTLASSRGTPLAAVLSADSAPALGNVHEVLRLRERRLHLASAWAGETLL